MIINNIKNFNLNSFKPLNTKNSNSGLKLHPQLTKDTISFKGNSKDNSSEYESRCTTLCEKRVNPRYASGIAKLDKRKYDKTLLLLNEHMSTQNAYRLGCLEDNLCAKALQLIKKGASPQNVEYFVQNQDKLNSYLYFLKKGASETEALMLCKCNKDEQSEVIKYISQGLSVHDAIKCTNYVSSENLFNELKETGYKPHTAGVLTNFEFLCYLNEEQIEKLAHIVEIIKANSKNCNKLSQELSDFYNKYILMGISIEELEKYVSKMDFEQIHSNAPITQKYSSSQLLSFIRSHYYKGTEDFTPEALTFKKDLTQYVSNNYVNSEKMNEILTAYPLTKREVGEVPEEWLDKTEDKNEAIKDIYSAITQFQNCKNTEKLAQDLSLILNKKVEAQKIGYGSLASVYKLTIEGSQPVCIKIFDSFQNRLISNLHGHIAEPQLGLFLNQHDNSYVKMYFGKVADKIKKDGFLVTQFIDENTSPDQNPNATKGRYYIEHKDAHKDNLINGIYIDFGGVEITRY